MKKYYVYILRCDDNSLYTGITNNIEKRMYAHIHKLKEAAAYTKSRNVVKMECLWTADNRSLASQLEYKVKKMTKEVKENLIQNPQQIKDFETVPIEDAYFKSILQAKGS